MVHGEKVVSKYITDIDVSTTITTTTTQPSTAMPIRSSENLIEGWTIPYTKPTTICRKILYMKVASLDAQTNVASSTALSTTGVSETSVDKCRYLSSCMASVRHRQVLQSSIRVP